MRQAAHHPVMVDEVVESLSPRDGATYVDGTFGAGGYSRALLKAASCDVIGIDRDPDAVARGRSLEADYPDRFRMIKGRFGDMDQLVPEADGIALDIGVSSMQIDSPERGFSFSSDGPLDMRMEGSDSELPSAADIVNDRPESELADIIFQYGEERMSRRIARAIVAARMNARIERTLQLAEIVARAVPRRDHKIHPATRTFQALRIYVNDELGELARGLAAAERILAVHGRLAIVTFHSLEDRIVKTFLAPPEQSASRHQPLLHSHALERSLRPLFRGVRTPGGSEIASNPRARSAKLRVAERIERRP